MGCRRPDTATSCFALFGNYSFLLLLSRCCFACQHAFGHRRSHFCTISLIKVIHWFRSFSTILLEWCLKLILSGNFLFQDCVCHNQSDSSVHRVMAEVNRILGQLVFIHCTLLRALLRKVRETASSVHSPQFF